ncbi:putative amino acid transporter [Trypanosoma vivax]|uniref:Putative amino acid transporter n=1 Tax=Trypanosoma vivax (strain Y486) TaxID=1055687 RepID=G0TZX9_TRYVY|nr:putative amino acid transporter [Trypanosoma vivax]CCC50159.1 putative amino acid transporter [Trypanosoma vivax Y486]
MLSWERCAGYTLISALTERGAFPQNFDSEAESHLAPRVKMTHIAGTNNREFSEQFTKQPTDASGPPTDAIECIELEGRTRESLPMRWARTLIPYGGLLSTVLNLASATVGVGISALPTGFSLSGIVMSSIYLAVIAIATIYSLNLIAKVAEKTGASTYGEASELLWGRRLSYYVAALMIVTCFGGAVAYVIVIGVLIRTALNRPSVPEYLKSPRGNRLMTTIAWLVLIVPLVIPKRINTLRYASGVGMILILYFSICVVVHSVQQRDDKGATNDVVHVKVGNAALEGLPLFLFSYICQPNAFAILKEMQQCTTWRYTIYSTVGILTCTLLYFLVGVFGYLEFGSRITDSVLALYDPAENAMMGLAYICFIVKVCMAFALHLIPLRDALYHFAKMNVDSASCLHHTFLMLFIATTALIFGLFIPKMNAVIGLVGSICAGQIGFILPALFYMYSGNFSLTKVGLLNYCGTYALLLTGVLAVVFGAIATVYTTATR